MEGEQPVLHTPRGAVPRGLKSDAFVARPAAVAPPAGQTVGALEARVPVVEASGDPNPAAVRQWDFALPDPALARSGDPFMQPDANRRRHAGPRAPAEADSIPATAREQFAENWDRLASEPARGRRRKAQRFLERSPLTRWLLSDGRFDFAAAAGPVLLLVLLGALIFYGRRLLAGEEKKTAPATETDRGRR